MEQRYYTTKQAAQYLGISRQELRKYARLQLIQFSRPGGKLMLFDKQELDKFIEMHRS